MMQLAVLDHNHHVDTPTAVTLSGEDVILCYKSRRTSEWVAYKKLSEKKYNYIRGK